VIFDRDYFDRLDCTAIVFVVRLLIGLICLGLMPARWDRPRNDAGRARIRRRTRPWPDFGGSAFERFGDAIVDPLVLDSVVIVLRTLFCQWAFE
jgi:hypothetical protein